MKKVLLVVAALALVLSGVNAADLGGDALALKATVSGEASFKFGVNLDDGDANSSAVDYATGFANSSEVGMVLTVVSERAQSDKGEGDVYAEIAIKEIKAVADGATATLANHVVFDYAKIYLGPVVMNVTGGDAKIDKAGAVTTKLTANTDLTSDMNGVGSLWVSLKDTSVVAVDIGVENKLPYADGVDVNSNNIYKLFGSVSLKAVENLELTVAANGNLEPGIKNAVAAAVGVDAAYTLKDIAGEGYSLKIMVGSDIGFVPSFYTKDAKSEMALDAQIQVSGGINFSVPGSELADQDNFKLTDIDYPTGITAKVGYTTTSTSSYPVDKIVTTGTNQMAVGVKFNAGTVVPNLTTYGYVDYVMPMNYTSSNSATQTTYDDNAKAAKAAASLAYGIRLGYTMDTIKPYAEVFVKDMGQEDFAVLAKQYNGVEELWVRAGVEIAAMKLTTVTISYTSDNLANVFTNGVNADTKSEATGKNGVVEFTVKVAL